MGRELHPTLMEFLDNPNVLTVPGFFNSVNSNPSVKSGKWEENFSCISKERMTLEENEQIDVVVKLKDKIGAFR